MTETVGQRLDRVKKRIIIDFKMMEMVIGIGMDLQTVQQQVDKPAL